MLVQLPTFHKQIRVKEQLCRVAVIRGLVSTEFCLSVGGRFDREPQNTQPLRRDINQQFPWSRDDLVNSAL